MAPCFLNVPIDAEIEWPRKEATVRFGRWEIIAHPPSREHDASLHLDLVRARLSDVEGMSVLNQLLSIAVWLDDSFAVLLPGWSGNPVPARPRRQSMRSPSSVLDAWCNAWCPLEEIKARRALAIYREAVNLDRFHSVPYSALGFYKIIESAGRAKNLGEEISQILVADGIEEYQLRQIGFTKKSSSQEIAKFLKEAGRDAVAHAKMEPLVDPDDTAQQRRMTAAAAILRKAARSCIKSVFRVGTNRWKQSDPG
jgi:hypothetical protein